MLTHSTYCGSSCISPVALQWESSGPGLLPGLCPLGPNRSYIRKKEGYYYTLYWPVPARMETVYLSCFKAHKIHHNRDNRGCLPVFGRDDGFGFVLHAWEWNKYGDNTHSHKNYMNAGGITTVYACEISPKCDIFFPALLPWVEFGRLGLLPPSLPQPSMHGVTPTGSPGVRVSVAPVCVMLSGGDTLSVLVQNRDQEKTPKLLDNLEQNTDLRKVLFICLYSLEETLMRIIV